MVPSQRGLGVTIKRGWKGRSARPNAPGVHINNIEHLGVNSCEPQQLASEVPMRKTAGLVEAPLGSPWSVALDRADCKQLMNLLRVNPRLVGQKGEGGFTVLHAAAMRGCLMLLDQVFDYFHEFKRLFEDEREGIELSLQELCKAEGIYSRRNKEGIGAAGLTAAEFAWWSMGNCEAREYLDEGIRYDSRTFLSFQHEIFAFSKDLKSDERLLLLGVLADHRSLGTAIWRHSVFERALEYNFVDDCAELRFHHACESNWDSKDYVEAVIGGCVEKGPHVLKYLFQLRNAQGQTPLHLAMKHAGYDGNEFLRLIPGQESRENAECLNMRDSRGWTALHCAFLGRDTDKLGVLLNDKRVDVNAKVARSKKFWDHNRATPLHLVVIHNRREELKTLLHDSRTDVNALFRKVIFFDDNLHMSGSYRNEYGIWTALQLVAMSGLPEIVKVLLTHQKVKDVGKRQKHDEEMINRIWDSQKISAIHLAAASGDPETLRLFITNQQFDPLVTCWGATALHFAVASRRPTLLQSLGDKPTYISNPVMEMEDFYTRAVYSEAKRKGAKIASYEGREACISILVHAGVDVWQKDDGGNFPEPGSSASSANHLSWQKMVASETLEAKKSLNEAGNAISVVAALVATASYVGPLQPPLGYADDFVQTSNLSIRIFMVTNSVSFYLAIASIMFAVVPSLPMPQEGIYEEWRRTRRTIGIAISLLLMSVLGVLISFAAASNAVVFEEYSWRHGGLTFYPAMVAGLVCLIGILWFFIRLLRLIFPKNVTIRHLYQSLCPIKE